MILLLRYHYPNLSLFVCMPFQFFIQQMFSVLFLFLFCGDKLINCEVEVTINKIANFRKY